MQKKSSRARASLLPVLGSHSARRKEGGASSNTLGPHHSPGRALHGRGREVLDASAAALAQVWVTLS